jgi:hypothetical protein
MHSHSKRTFHTEGARMNTVVFDRIIWIWDASDKDVHSGEVALECYGSLEILFLNKRATKLDIVVMLRSISIGLEFATVWFSFFQPQVMCNTPYACPIGHSTYRGEEKAYGSWFDILFRLALFISLDFWNIWLEHQFNMVSKSGGQVSVLANILFNIKIVAASHLSHI